MVLGLVSNVFLIDPPDHFSLILHGILWYFPTIQAIHGGVGAIWVPHSVRRGRSGSGDSWQRRIRGKTRSGRSTPTENRWRRCRSSATSGGSSRQQTMTGWRWRLTSERRGWARDVWQGLWEGKGRTRKCHGVFTLPWHSRSSSLGRRRGSWQGRWSQPWTPSRAGLQGV